MKLTKKAEVLAFLKEIYPTVHENTFLFHLVAFVLKNHQRDKLINHELLEAISSWSWKEDGVHKNSRIGLALSICLANNIYLLIKSNFTF